MKGILVRWDYNQKTLTEWAQRGPDIKGGLVIPPQDTLFFHLLIYFHQHKTMLIVDQVDEDTVARYTKVKEIEVPEPLVHAAKMRLEWQAALDAYQKDFTAITKSVNC